MLATPNIDYYANKTRENWSKYCIRHGYNFTCYRKHVIEDMHIVWSKVAILEKHLRNTKSHWVIMVDADTTVQQQEQTLDALTQRYDKDVQMLISEDCSRRFGLPIPLSLNGVIKSGQYRPPNVGFLAMRKTPFSIALMQEWLALARGTLADIADVFPRQQNVFWVGLLRKYRPHIVILGSEVMRVGMNDMLDTWTMQTDKAFILHDKRLTNQESS
ncbi:MAG: hypothetical protein AAGA36_06035 [Pseudomonadota bacterium]